MRFSTLFEIQSRKDAKTQRLDLQHFASLRLCVTLLCLATSACRDKPAPALEPAVLGHEKAASTEPAPLPHPTTGNFENLVADYENKDRVIWQKPDLVISLLGDLTGKTVADIGAGTGFFTFRLVPKAKKTIGVDIDPRFISFMDSVKVRLPEPYRARFETRLGKLDDPLLRPGEADAVVIVNTYGYIENRVAYLKTLLVGMAPNAQLLIIDFKRNSPGVGPADEFKVGLEAVEKELAAAGLSVVREDKEALDYQYIVLAKRR